MLEARIDTARFDQRRWYVDGYGAHWFTSKEDAEAAIRLAEQHALNERRELGRQIAEILP